MNKSFPFFFPHGERHVLIILIVTIENKLAKENKAVLEHLCYISSLKTFPSHIIVYTNSSQRSIGQRFQRTDTIAVDFYQRKWDIQTKDKLRRQSRDIWCWTSWASSRHQGSNIKGKFLVQNTPHLYIYRQYLYYQDSLRPKAISRTTTSLYLLPTYAIITTKEPNQYPQSHVVPRPFRYSRKWTSRPTSQRSNSASLIIKTNNHT